ncbi:thiamine phosphate synthase [Pedobacter deserti]|uniref:thiamine phosphate synthase n=1 Tax=Pedobacter deserti TaxID=2817382 RepID=UPI00210C9958|nr:thiamine phosphate synthase [Pedobacter sp. SYSU D00382]
MIDQLHYISNAIDSLSTLNAISDVLNAGGKWIQLRMKHAAVEEILETGVKALQLCNEYGARLIVNDHPEVARQIAAHGVHLGLADMPVPEARALLGPDMIIGGTANTIEDIGRRAAEKVDYIGLGPYRFTDTKQNLSPILGLGGYENVMQQMRDEGITIPVIAIGGIMPADIPQLMSAGVHGIAVSSALTGAGDLRSRLAEMNELIKSFKPVLQ